MASNGKADGCDGKGLAESNIITVIVRNIALYVKCRLKGPKKALYCLHDRNNKQKH